MLREVALRRRRAACEAERGEEPVVAVEPEQEEEEEDTEDAAEFPDIVLGAKFLPCLPSLNLSRSVVLMVAVGGSDLGDSGGCCCEEMTSLDLMAC